MASISPTEAGGWRVSVCKLGVRDTRTFPKGTTKTAAGQWGTTREAEIIRDANEKRAQEENRTVRQLIEEWTKMKLPTRESYEWEAGRCKWFLKNLPFLDLILRELDADDIEEWIAERSMVVAGSSINRDLQLLGPILKYGIKRKWIAVNPLEAVERPANGEPRDVRIDDKATDAVIAALGYTRGTEPLTKPERVAVAFLLALETGMRKGEMLKTERPNIHADYIHLPSRITKNRSKRDVPLSTAARALVALLPAHWSTLLGDLSTDTADALFRAARVKAGYPDLHFHDTRHEAVTRLARRLEILPLSRMIGHRDLNSLKVYYNATPQEIAAMLG
jgi:integrase